MYQSEIQYFGIHSAEFNINGSAAAVNTSQVLGLGSDAGFSR